MPAMSTVLNLLGGLGIFLYGLRVMSGGLQKVAGNRMREVLSKMTQNRVSGVFSGFLLTTIAQSSSATTVMMVSFANAGLLTLSQAIGLVMGANIGTTVTLWLVALLGFKVKIAAFALPSIGIGFFFSLLGNEQIKKYSEALIGFGLLFLGLSILKDSVPNLQSNPEALEFIRHFGDLGFGSSVLFVAIGSVLTVVVQSSSAASAITVALLAKGWISFDLAAAMILGENIGTTITAQLAAIGANRNARRVAQSHTIFNLIGVLWMLPIMSFVVPLVQGFVADTPTQLAVFHTAFNVLNTSFLIWFVPQIQRVVEWLTPILEEERGVSLKFLESGLLATPELASWEARRAIQHMLIEVKKILVKTQRVVLDPRAKLGKVIVEVKQGEGRTDEMEEQIVEFCAQLARAGTSEQIGVAVARMLEMTGDIERMGDHCMNLILLAERRYEKKYRFGAEAESELAKLMEAVLEQLTNLIAGFVGENPYSVTVAEVAEREINAMRSAARKKHARRMQEGTVRVKEGLVFLDMMTNLEKIGDYCFNVVKASQGLSPHPRLSANN